MTDEVSDHMHWTARNGKNLFPLLGMGAFHWISLGLTAAGIGLQAYAGSKDKTTRVTGPKLEEEAKAIRRQAAFMQEVRKLRERRHSTMGKPIVELLNTSVDAGKGRLVTQTGREAIRSGMEPPQEQVSPTPTPTQNIPAQTPGPRPTLTATSTPTVTPTPTPTPTLGEAQGRRDPINLHGDPRLTQIQNILDTTQPAEEPARRVPVGEDWRGSKIGEAERNLREAAKRKLRASKEKTV